MIWITSYVYRFGGDWTATPCWYITNNISTMVYVQLIDIIYRTLYTSNIKMYPILYSTIFKTPKKKTINKWEFLISWLKDKNEGVPLSNLKRRNRNIFHFSTCFIYLVIQNIFRHSLHYSVPFDLRVFKFYEWSIYCLLMVYGLIFGGPLSGGPIFSKLTLTV